MPNSSLELPPLPTARVGHTAAVLKCFILVRQGKLLALLSLSLTLVLLSATSSAHAEWRNITAQAKAMHAEWLAYAPPPPAKKAVCLIDTGVTMNPDTSNVIYRESLDGGDPNDAGPPDHMHGTEMAMAMVAPKNDWGMVGIAPQSVDVVSIRSNIPGKVAFSRTGYQQGLKECFNLHFGGTFYFTAAEMAIAGAETDPTYIQKTTDEINRLNISGISAVVAAGNRPGSLTYPALIDPALSVGAYDPETGGLCGFSASGADVLAPGCGVEAADPSTGGAVVSWGTSSASALVAAVLTALRSYRPDLSRQQAEELLLSTAQQTTAGKLVDVEALFRAAGLGELVDAGKGALPAGGAGQPIPPVGVPSQPAPPGKGTVLPKPVIRSVKRVRDTLTVRVKPIDDDVTFVVQALRGAVKRQKKSETFRVALKLRGARKLICWFESPGAKASVKTVVDLRRLKK